MAANDAFMNNGLYITSVMPIALRLGAGKSGVISGCAVSQQTVPDMTVKSSAGVILLNKIRIAVAANATITINTAHATLDRYDLISVNSSGTIVYTAGTASSTCVPPEIPASNVPLAVIYVAATVTSIADAVIYDLRITVIKDFLGGYFGSGADGSVNQTSGTYAFNTQVKQFTDLTIANGAAMTFSGYGKYICFVTGNLTINGTVNISDRAGTTPIYADAINGANAGTAPTAGSAGTPSGVYSVYLLNKIMTESSNGGVGGLSTTNASGGGGGGGSGSTSGGAGGAGESGGIGGGRTGGAGGNGKACVWFIVGGNISIGSTAVINGNGNAGAAGQGGGSGPITAGGGGGGGGAANILLYAGDNLALTTGAVINLIGGAGGAGGEGLGGTVEGGGGGGGAGGTFQGVCYSTLTTGATITVTGGAGGAAGGAGATAGSAGSNGISISAQLT